MRGGTAFAIAMCAAWGSAVTLAAARPETAVAAASSDSVFAETGADTVFFSPSEYDSASALGDSLGVFDLGFWGSPRAVRPSHRGAELAAQKSLWELLAGVPEVRWSGGSGAMGGLEAIHLRGRYMRRATLMADGAPMGPDLNAATPAVLDSFTVLDGILPHQDVLLDGAEAVEVHYDKRGAESREGHLSLGRGDFQSRFSSIAYKGWNPSWWFGLDFSGASFGRAASYDSYIRDGGGFGGGLRLGSDAKLSVRARRFKSKVVRYAGDKTKSSLGSLLVSGESSSAQTASWRARAYYLGGRYEYFENGPQLEDDVWSVGGGFDYWPAGTEGAHRLSLGFRRESIERSVGPFLIPEGFEIYGPPDEGARRSSDLSLAYTTGMGSGGARVTALVRVDHKSLFGWRPTLQSQLRTELGSWGKLVVSGGRSSYMPGFLEIYAPRDETARPTWYMASDLDPETEWSLSTRLALGMGRWTAAVGAYGVLRDHVLAPPSEWLGLNRGSVPIVALPVEDFGEGSGAGAWISMRRAVGSWLDAGGLYSVQRVRVGGVTAPFQPQHKAGLWVQGEVGFFENDMRLGVLLKGCFYSSQQTHLDFELPSYGVGEGMAYVAIADITFFYQLKNLETRARPSRILDAEAGEYLLQPGPEVRMGLVWYLPD